MTERSGTQAGGAILALTIILGAVIGTVLGQSSIGVVAGTAIGIVAVLVVWQRDRARRGR